MMRYVSALCSDQLLSVQHPGLILIDTFQNANPNLGTQM
jgi:hypothetical protein